MEVKGKTPLDISCSALKTLGTFAFLPVMVGLNHVCKTLRNTWIKNSAVVISINLQFSVVIALCCLGDCCTTFFLK